MHYTDPERTVTPQSYDDHYFTKYKVSLDQEQDPC